jgi:hypothetical protein
MIALLAWREVTASLVRYNARDTDCLGAWNDVRNR